MWKIRHHSAWPIVVLAAALVLTGFAHGQSSNENAQLLYPYPPYVPPSQSSVYNQNSVYLPTPPVAHGSDMVRGAGGVTCQSAVGSGGPYLDVGLIGSQDVYNRETASFYGRIVVPLGDRPKRPDCTKLYELEISRMRMEIELLRMGLPPGLGGVAAPVVQVSNNVRADGSAAGAPLTIASPAKAHGLGAGLQKALKLVPVPRLKPKRVDDSRMFVKG